MQFKNPLGIKGLKPIASWPEPVVRPAKIADDIQFCRTNRTLRRPHRGKLIRRLNGNDVRLRGSRQMAPESAAHAGLAGHADATALDLNRQFTKGEAQAAGGTKFTGWLAEPAEFLEYA